MRHPIRAGLKPYLRKYREGIKELGMTVEEFSNSYSVPIIVIPLSMRGLSSRLGICISIQRRAWKAKPVASNLNPRYGKIVLIIAQKNLRVDREPVCA
jgi:hypothetical protein